MLDNAMPAELGKLDPHEGCWALKSPQIIKWYSFVIFKRTSKKRSQILLLMTLSGGLYRHKNERLTQKFQAISENCRKFNSRICREIKMIMCRIKIFSTQNERSASPILTAPTPKGGRRSIASKTRKAPKSQNPFFAEPCFLQRNYII